MADELMIVFENAPGHEPARFVEVENATMGGSVEIKWHNYGEADRWELGPFVKHEDAVALEAEIERIRNAARSILWMAEKYAEGGGSRGPEMRDYQAAAEIIGED